MNDYYLYVFNQKESVSTFSLPLDTGLLEPVINEGHERAVIKIFSLSGVRDTIKSTLYDQSLVQGFDYCLLPKSQSYGPFKLAIFDMDSTLIPIEVIDELAVQAGAGEAVAKITEAAMRGEIDFNQSLEQRVKQLKGLSMTAIEVVKNQLEFNPGVVSFCQFFVEQSGKIGIASGGFLPFAEVLARRLPFSHVEANRLIDDQGALTGEVAHPIVNADVKADSLRKWAKSSGLLGKNCIAVGDGANDLKMLQQAGIGIAYKAKPALGRSADCVLNIGHLDSLVELLPIIEQQHKHQSD